MCEPSSGNIAGGARSVRQPLLALTVIALGCGKAAPQPAAQARPEQTRPSSPSTTQDEADRPATVAPEHTPQPPSTVVDPPSDTTPIPPTLTEASPALSPWPVPESSSQLTLDFRTGRM